VGVTRHRLAGYSGKFRQCTTMPSRRPCLLGDPLGCRVVPGVHVVDLAQRQCRGTEAQRRTERDRGDALATPARHHPAACLGGQPFGVQPDQVHLTEQGAGGRFGDRPRAAFAGRPLVGATGDVFGGHGFVVDAPPGDPAA
jgi:hypothetical protein